MRLVKLFLAIALLPACVAVSSTTWDAARTVISATAQSGPILGWAFAAGYGLWLAVFLLLPRPTRTYVLGHELTHALWALLMGARVGGLKVGKSGGQVRTSKTNWAITLAPYFFHSTRCCSSSSFLERTQFGDWTGTSGCCFS